MMRLLSILNLVAGSFCLQPSLDGFPIPLKPASVSANGLHTLFDGSISSRYRMILEELLYIISFVLTDEATGACLKNNTWLQ